jgi:hypothetical protein
LAVAVALGLALASPPLNLANFLGLEVEVLLLHWLREGVGELLAEALVGGLSVLLPDLGRRHIKWIIFGIFITPTALGVL